MKYIGLKLCYMLVTTIASVFNEIRIGSLNIYMDLKKLCVIHKVEIYKHTYLTSSSGADVNPGLCSIQPK